MPNKRKCAPCRQARRRKTSGWLDGYFSNFMGFGARVPHKDALIMVLGCAAFIAACFALLHLMAWVVVIGKGWGWW